MSEPSHVSLVHDPVRLASLASLGLLDTQPEAEFDDIAQLAALVCNVPVALVSLVAGDRQWFKARVGFPRCETGLNASVCAYALSEPDILTISDLSLDPRTRDNPLVTGDPFIRFYAGVPLHAPDGQTLGSLCVIDRTPRPDGLTADQAESLRGLGRQVATVLRGRQVNQELKAARDALRISEDRLTFAFDASGSVGWWDWDIPTDRLYAGERFARMFGVDPAEAARGAPLAAFVGGIHPDDREWVGARIRHAIETAGDFSEEYRLRHADGSVTWVHARGRCYHDGAGRPLRYPGVVVDVTARRLAEAARIATEARLNTVMETVPVGILLAEAPSGRILMGNRYLADILGHDTLYAASSDAYGGFVAYHADGRLVTARDYPLAQITGGETKKASLEAQYQRPDGTRRWIAISGEAIENDRGETIGAVVAVTDISDRKAAEANQDLLNRELSHRLKNTLTLVQSIASQTLRNTPDLDAARDALTARLIVLGKAHDVLLSGPNDSARVDQIVQSALSLHDDTGGRFQVAGPAFSIGPAAALSLGLMLHELATNAAKYGALSVPEGDISIGWSLHGEGAAAEFRLEWCETGGPPVSPPTRKGFGSRLIQRGLAGGAVALVYPVTGVRCTFTAPIAGLRLDA